MPSTSSPSLGRAETRLMTAICAPCSKVTRTRAPVSERQWPPPHRQPHPASGAEREPQRGVHLARRRQPRWAAWTRSWGRRGQAARQADLLLALELSVSQPLGLRRGARAALLPGGIDRRDGLAVLGELDGDALCKRRAAVTSERRAAVTSERRAAAAGSAAAAAPPPKADMAAGRALAEAWEVAPRLYEAWVTCGGCALVGVVRARLRR